MKDNDRLYGGRWKALTVSDAEEMERINVENHWGISCNEFDRLVALHEQARSEGDVRTMERIEFRLEDINFHTECRFLEAGDYKAAKDNFYQEVW